MSNGARETAERFRRFLPYFGAGLAGVVVIVLVVLYVQRGAHMELKGSIQKVRTLGLPDNSTVVVADFRFANNADYPFVVRNVAVLLETGEGQTVEGAVVSEADAKNLFTYYPALGQKFNETLLMKTKIPPHESMDRMIAARFEMPEQQVQNRKGLRIRVLDVDGAESEIREGQ